MACRVVLRGSFREGAKGLLPGVGYRDARMVVICVISADWDVTMDFASATASALLPPEISVFAIVMAPV